MNMGVREVNGTAVSRNTCSLRNRHLEVMGEERTRRTRKTHEGIGRALFVLTYYFQTHAMQDSIPFEYDMALHCVRNKEKQK